MQDKRADRRSRAFVRHTPTPTRAEVTHDFLLHHHTLIALMRSYGIWGVGLVVLLESMGLPLPGESAVISAAIFASTTGQIDILPLVAAVAAGAVVGDNIGYIIGRKFGWPLLQRFGPRLGLTADRLALLRMLFRRHGGALVTFGRFLVILRTFAALLAGAAAMRWPRFLLYNALGGVAWASLYGFGAYLLGREALHLRRPLGIALAAAAILAAACLVWLLRRAERRLLRAGGE